MENCARARYTPSTYILEIENLTEIQVLFRISVDDNYNCMLIQISPVKRLRDALPCPSCPGDFYLGYFLLNLKQTFD